MKRNIRIFFPIDLNNTNKQKLWSVEDKLSYRNSIFFSLILTTSLITMIISSVIAISVSYTNASPVNNNTNINTNSSNAHFNTTNALYHIDKAQAALQMDDIAGALRHLDIAKQSLGSNPLHTIQPVTPPKNPISPPKGPIKQPTEPASNLSKENH